MGAHSWDAQNENQNVIRFKLHTLVDQIILLWNDRCLFRKNSLMQIYAPFVVYQDGKFLKKFEKDIKNVPVKVM
ncbi:hypothetical protein IC582_010149 [Cucumis melo]